MEDFIKSVCVEDINHAQSTMFSLFKTLETASLGSLTAKAEMIHNILEFDDKTTKDIMTHRKNLIAIDGELSYLDAVSFIIETGKSRFPVYANDIDNIIGVLHIKDAFAYAQRNEVFRTSIKDIPGLVRSVDFVPETLNINVLFKNTFYRNVYVLSFLKVFSVIGEYFIRATTYYAKP